MDLFNMVPENFFSMLASKNKRIYLQAILQAFKVYETGSILGIDKKIVVDDLTLFLENTKLNYSTEDENDEESTVTTKRELANYILRRMEECGWIYVDVTNDYVEILNFSDAGITICEAIFKAYPQMEHGEDFNEEYNHAYNYNGYIYQINALLQDDNPNYSMTFSLVYSNTKMLIRSIRRLDSRLKDYITSVIENSEIKDLMEKLISFKTDIYDSAYVKLKVSDNINRYRLSIVTKLMEMQSNELAMDAIAKSYMSTNVTYDMALSKANKHVDEVIDAFNAIEEFIQEIDIKNKNYINSTIGKIKFLLSEDDNVVGKINRILKHVKDSNKNNKIDKSMRLVDSLYDLRTQKIMAGENSLYTPRGSYVRNPNMLLGESGIDLELDKEFLESFKSLYNESYLNSFLNANLVDGKFTASSVISYDMSDAEFMQVVYCIIFAADNDYKITINNNKVEHKKFIIKDFVIERGR